MRNLAAIRIVLALALGSLASPTLGVDAQHRALVLLLDASGSLVKTDPTDLRAEAARMLIATAPDGDRASVMAFAGDVLPLTQEWVAIDSQSRERLRDRAGQVPRNGRFTDHVAALDAAADLLERTPKEFRAQYKPTVVLFTDGVLDPDPARGGTKLRLASLPATLGRLKALDADVYAIGLGEADAQFLQQIAAATDGNSLTIRAPDEMLRAFWLLRERLSGALAILDQKNVTGTVSFEVPKWASGFSVAVLGRAVEGQALTGPTSKGCLSTAGRAYTVFRCERPTQGAWSVRLGSGKADVVVAATGDLNLNTILEPSELVAGELLRAATSIRAGDEVLRGLPSLADATATLAIGSTEIPLYDDGASGDEIAGDGKYSRMVRPPNAGTELLRWRLRGQRLDFKTSQQVSVVPAPVEAKVEEAQVSCFLSEGCTTNVTVKSLLKQRPVRLVAAGDWTFAPMVIAPGKDTKVRVTFVRPEQGSVERKGLVKVEGYERPSEVTVFVERLSFIGWLRHWWFITAPAFLVVVAAVGVALKPASNLGGRVKVSMVDGDKAAYVATHDMNRFSRKALAATDLMPGVFEAGRGFVLRSRRSGLGSASWLEPDTGNPAKVALGRSRSVALEPRKIGRGDSWTAIGVDGKTRRFEYT